MWTARVDNPSGPGVIDGTDFPGAGSRTWRPPTGLVVVLAAFGAVAIVAVVLPREALDRGVTVLVGAVLLVVALILGRRRLTAGPRGLVIGGLAGQRIVPWSTVRAVSCGRTRRMGSATLELDLVDDELLLFGRFDLGADPADVEAELIGWFTARD